MTRTTFATLAIAASLLSACGQKPATESSQTTPTTTTPTMTAPAQPTSAEVQRKLAELPAPFDKGDPENGKRVFARCQVCHTVTEGGPDLVGPNLWGIFGRKVASKPGYTYSDALKAKSYTWDAPHLDAWLTNPRDVAPGTKMSFAGLAEAQDRADVIAYLKTATSK